MKQHITFEQWNELNPKQWEVIENNVSSSINSIDVGMSIGQMIEFLGTKKLHYVDDSVDNVCWHSKYGDNPFMVALGWTGEELCDALWKAVKNKLKNETNNNTTTKTSIN